jgi:predicted double-glycine peptidase
MSENETKTYAATYDDETSKFVVRDETGKKYRGYATFEKAQEWIAKQMSKPTAAPLPVSIRFDLPESWGAIHLAAALLTDYGSSVDPATLAYRKADGRLVIEGQPVAK